MIYTWSIKTSDVMLGGTDGDAYLALNGLDAAMREVQITDRKTYNDFEKGDTNSGSIQTEDLGELQNGTLRVTDSGPSPDWLVDWVKIRNEEDGREWTATLGTWSSDQPESRWRLRFSQTDPGNYETMQRQKAAAARKMKEKADADKAAADLKTAEAKRAQDEAAADAAATAEEAAAQRKFEEMSRQADRDLKQARLEAELAKKRAEIDKLKNESGASVPTGGTAPAGFRTYELFGMVNGNRVPLASAVTQVAGVYSVVPGGKVMVGDQPTDGYGFAGIPGKWASVAGGSPAAVGQDPDRGIVGFDGSRAWPLPATFLTSLFGANWRTVIY